MCSILLSIVFKLPDFFLRWLDRSVVRVNVVRLEYALVDGDTGLPRITSCPSRYSAKVAFAHRGKATTIKGLTLIVDDGIELEATRFNPLKLEHGDYRVRAIAFPVEEEVAIAEGAFEMRAIDAFGKTMHRCRGRFPIRSS